MATHETGLLKNHGDLKITNYRKVRMSSAKKRKLSSSEPVVPSLSQLKNVIEEQHQQLLEHQQVIEELYQKIQELSSHLRTQGNLLDQICQEVTKFKRSEYNLPNPSYIS